MNNYVQDQNAFLICPYDSNHRIRGSTWHTHIIKCKKVNAEIAKDFEKCPFTGAHIIHKSEMAEHIIACSGRAQIESHLDKS
jgi:hypothetical protein